jgi:small-conductance mechanosensitive channel
MPHELDVASVTDQAVTAAWLVGAVVGAYLLGWAVSWVLRRLGGRSGLVKDLAVFTRRPFRVTLMVIAANIAVNGTIDASVSWRAGVDHLLQIAQIATITWLVASLVLVAERRAIARFAGGDTEMGDADLQRRRVRTQVTTLRRLAIAIVVFLGTAAALMTFPSFKQIGTTLFASAGVLSLVAGLAAQTSLGLVFAGMQIAFSNAIRVGDVVLIEDLWGRIEEITLTYVVVGSWDQRRLVLPTTYFTTTPFENWTRHGSELLGTVYFDVDFTVPLDPMRAELDRLLAESDLWDGRSSSLVVTDAVGGYLQLRITVSAADSGALWALRCAVREGMIEWLRRTNPAALPRWRVENPPTRAITADSDFVGASGARGDAE